MQPTLAVDFDGVIASYDGWKGYGVLGEPIEGAVETLRKLKHIGWKIIIFTTRGEEEIFEYLRQHRIPFDEINHNSNLVGSNPGKPVATCYLDDRAICFTGDWEKAFNDITSFRSWGETV
jgi:hydroxymethylpyrimidine pyrophosphatase-like HAD family hydrolase